MDNEFRVRVGFEACTFSFEIGPDTRVVVKFTIYDGVNVFELVRERLLAPLRIDDG